MEAILFGAKILQESRRESMKDVLMEIIEEGSKVAYQESRRKANQICRKRNETEFFEEDNFIGKDNRKCYKEVTSKRRGYQGVHI